MNKQANPKLFGRTLPWSRTELILAGVLILPGLVLLIWPTLVPELILAIIGALVILAGAVLALKYLLQDAKGAGYSNSLGIGLALIGVGVLIIVLRKALISLIPLLCGILLLLGGIAKLQAALNLRAHSARGWKLQLVGTALSIVLGVIIILNPFSTAKLLMRILGAALIVEALQDLLAGSAYKRARGKNTVIEAHFKD